MKKIIIFTSLLVALFLIVGCNKTETPAFTVGEIIESIEITYQAGDDQDHVTKDLILPKESPLDSKAIISWVSDQPDIIDNLGTVKRLNEDVAVNLSFTVYYYGSSFSQVMTFTVYGEHIVFETTYEVHYYFENLDDDEYTLTKSEEMNSVVGRNIAINPKNEAGYSLNTELSILSGKAMADKSFNLVIYYDRNLYNVRLYDGNDLLDTLEVKYGTVLELENRDKEDYEFLGWKENNNDDYFDFSNPVSKDLDIKAIFKELNDPFTYTGYYEGAGSLYGDDLVVFLNQILNNTMSGVSYGDARYMLDDTDVDPSNASNVILIYLGTSVSGVWDDGATWNREHVWPQSKLGGSAENSRINIASDLHNLKPSNPSTNSSRGNKFFGTETGAYEPRDAVKGDIARILFYMDVMYNGLSLISANSGGSLQMGNLDKLLEWHVLDPVDEFEMYRNNKIETYQGNRNPFIDHQEFVDKIYGTNDDTLSFEMPSAILGTMIFDLNYA